MNIAQVLEAYAQQVNGHYFAQGTDMYLLTIPLDGLATQQVLAIVKYSEKYEKTGIELSAKVMPYNQELDLDELLRANVKMCYARFVLEDNFIKVEANTFLEHLQEPLLHEMINEVARNNAEWQERLRVLDTL